MDFVIFDALDPNRLERPQSHMQSDFDGVNSALANAIQDFRCEMQSRRGRRDRPDVLGVDRLVALAVAGRIRARNVRWKRHVADAVKSREEIINRLKAYAPLTEFSAGENFCMQLIVRAEEQPFSDSDFAAGTNQALPIIRLTGNLAGKQNFNASVKKIAGGGIVQAHGLGAGTRPAAVETRGKDTCVVEDHDISRLQELRKVAEHAVGPLSARALK